MPSATPVSRRPNTPPPTPTRPPPRSAPSSANRAAQSEKAPSAARPPASQKGCGPTTHAPHRTSSSFRRSPLFAETQRGAPNGAAAARTPSCQLPSMYSTPPTNPRQAQSFWNQMAADNATLAEQHKAKCRAKGIELKGRPSTPPSHRSRLCHTAPSGFSRTGTANSNAPNGAAINGNGNTNGNGTNARSQKRTTGRRAGLETTRRGNGTMRRARPAISAPPRTNGHFTPQKEEVAPPTRATPVALSLGRISYSTSGGRSPPTRCGHRMNCRTETAPFIDNGAAEKGGGCVPQRLEFDVVEEGPQVTQQEEE